MKRVWLAVLLLLLVGAGLEWTGEVPPDVTAQDGGEDYPPTPKP